MKGYWFLSLLTIWQLAHPGMAYLYQVEIDPGYNLHKSPPTEDKKPLLIEASINLRNILDVDEKAMLVSMETSLRLYWKEPRIRPVPEYLDSEDKKGWYTTLNPSLAKELWIPDIFIDQAKTIRNPTFYTQPASLRVYMDSTIRYSSRINFDVACNMDFRRYPVDTQFCEIKFESFGFQSNQIDLKWIPNSMDINSNITLAQFNFHVQNVDSYDTDYYDVNYPGLILQLHLTRQIGYHIVQTYIPSIIFVILGWLSLFVPPEAIPGRVGMGMTTILTQTSMFSSVRQNVPKVSYITVLDVWMLICMMFVFSCMLEFIVVMTLIRKKDIKKANKIESVFKVLLPIIFLLINVGYWPTILEDYFQLDSGLLLPQPANER